MNANRSERKRQAIMEAATQLFLENGYTGTSMDQIAARAMVSKLTVYKNFADKQQLFATMTMTVAQAVDALVDDITGTLDNAQDLETDLRDLARRYVTAVIQPDVLRMRRLVIAEAPRFPELARSYYERAPERALKTLATGFQRLTERGLLRIDEPLDAAHHFASLILAIPLDHAMFHPKRRLPSVAQLHEHADHAVGVFLAAYGTG
jgi:TetR/AcrR family transcriptional regulator, mexJK operon transcriptional repressor